MVQWLAAYMALSSLVGLTVTYYYDDPDNKKLNVILQRGLQLFGAVLVYASPALPEAGASAVALLVLGYLLHGRQLSWVPRCFCFVIRPGS